MPHTAEQRQTISAGATRLVRFNFTNDLDDGALLTGTPTVAEVTSVDLTLAAKIVNIATYTDNEDCSTVAIGKAVQFTCAGGTVNTTYRIRITCTTDSTPAEILVWDVLLTVI